MVKLTVVAGPDTGKVFTQVRETISIGRGEDCDVVLRDGTVSRRHCAIQRNDQRKISLSDLFTPNGTFLNDINNRIQTCDLRSGDEIIIGKSWLQVELVEERRAEQTAGAGRNEKPMPDEAASMSLPKNWQSGMTVVASRLQLPLPEAAKRRKEKEHTGLFVRLKRFFATMLTLSRK
jgi:pSer/pThr/pTyr-binding forkhead associated (FHA) protein